MQSLTCQYCGHVNEIPVDEAAVAEARKERDFRAVIAESAEEKTTEEIYTTHCDGCGAETTLPPDVQSDECPFCGTPVQRAQSAHRQIKPQGILPFSVETDVAAGAFRKWIKGLWFAPNKLKRMSNHHQTLKGVYLPHWTYDADTQTHYRGERGDNYRDYYTDSQGKRRSRVKTRWSYRFGTVRRYFDDIVVTASRSLPKKYVEKLEPWDLEQLVPVDPAYLAGFRAERYQIGLEEGFAEAQSEMRKQIERDVRHDIGGDKQRISSMDTDYLAITFRHILLPVWASAYRYGDKTYRFVINARTGEVQGERPWSWWKITLAVLAALLLIAVIVYAANSQNVS